MPVVLLLLLAPPTTPQEAIRGFLAHAREELADLPVRSTADVFGVTTSFRRDIGLGQLWETFIDVVDVALPMVYPSHYWEGSYGYDNPNAYPYEVVKAALEDAVRRSKTHSAVLGWNRNAPRAASTSRPSTSIRTRVCTSAEMILRLPAPPRRRPPGPDRW